jgi:hypothetical protein
MPRPFPEELCTRMLPQVWREAAWISVSRSVSQAWRNARSGGGGLRQAQKPDSEASSIRHAVWIGRPSAPSS